MRLPYKQIIRCRSHTSHHRRGLCSAMNGHCAKFTKCVPSFVLSPSPFANHHAPRVLACAGCCCIRSFVQSLCDLILCSYFALICSVSVWACVGVVCVRCGAHRCGCPHSTMLPAVALMMLGGQHDYTHTRTHARTHTHTHTHTYTRARALPYEQKGIHEVPARKPWTPREGSLGGTDPSAGDVPQVVSSGVSE